MRGLLAPHQAPSAVEYGLRPPGEVCVSTPFSPCHTHTRSCIVLYAQLQPPLRVRPDAACGKAVRYRLVGGACSLRRQCHISNPSNCGTCTLLGMDKRLDDGSLGIFLGS
eukprot:COSAG01_NODE_175_length_22996_cov_18.857892_8_plen_110_part_00